MLLQSPNDAIRPVTASVNEQDHLVIGGVDSVELAEEYGTPLWVMDEQTIHSAINAYKQGLQQYPNAQILYAGKAFLCLAMCHLIKQQGLGLDVVSAGELFTAIKAQFPAESIYMHGNNKSAAEIAQALDYGDVRIVVDSRSELEMVAAIAGQTRRTASILFRVIPGVQPETHQHIVTGHANSKFGIDLAAVPPMVARALELSPAVKVLGLHAHIGSQTLELKPYCEHVEVLVNMLALLKRQFGIELPELDVGGGLGIAYVADEVPVSIYDWTKGIANHVQTQLKTAGLALPKLLVEPGRSIVGTAGVTLYRAGHKKALPSGVTYISVDGGMADNPRPITYQAEYTAALANRMNARPLPNPVSLAGKFCESGDIIIKEMYLPAETGDLIAVFGTGAYNYSMASNYNRTARPACVLVSTGKSDIIIERETNDDLISHDRVPEHLMR